MSWGAHDAAPDSVRSGEDTFASLGERDSIGVGEGASPSTGRLLVENAGKELENGRGRDRVAGVAVREATDRESVAMTSGSVRGARRWYSAVALGVLFGLTVPDEAQADGAGPGEPVESRPTR